MTANPFATQNHGHGFMHDLTTERNFDSKGAWVIGVRGLFLDMWSTGVYTTEH